MRYGIPDFRLPNAVIDAEIDNLRKLGVKFECNTLVGRLFTVEQAVIALAHEEILAAVDEHERLEPAVFGQLDQGFEVGLVLHQASLGSCTLPRAL